MDDLVTQALADDKPSDFHEQTLTDCRGLVHISRSKMQSYYETWDRNESVFRGETVPDKSDIAARERKEPAKIVVPITYSQIQTFVAFASSLLFQRDRVFELVGFTPEDDKPAKVGESLLARDLAYNKFKAKISQFYTDIGRFSVGVMKVAWHTEKQFVREQVQQAPTMFGGALPLGGATTREIEREIVSYQGNRIFNISPYRFYPDTRLPFSRFQEGEFCASDELYSRTQLKQWEREGLVTGVDFIKPIAQDVWQSRGYKWNDWIATASEPSATARGDGQLKKMILVTEVQRRIIPSEYKINDEPLGEEDYPVLWNFWIANDQRVIKAEPMNYVHNQFTYVMAPFLYDNNSTLGLGLADIIDQLQSVITWFINSRITSVRKTIDNKFLINPKFVNFSDVENRRPYIRLLESAPGDLDRYIKQLSVTDVTGNHIQDAKFLHEMVQVVTGINDSLLGQFQPGRRSATEHRNVTTGSAARLKTVVQTTYDVALEPLAQQMLSNLRDGLDEETYVRLLGRRAEETPEFIAVTKEDLVGHYGFELFDGTMPSERAQVAQVLSDLATGFISNPEAGLALGYDVRKMLNEILTLRGVKNPERFMVEPQPAVLQPPAAGNVGGTGVPQPGAVPPRVNGAIPQPMLGTGSRTN